MLQKHSRYHLSDPLWQRVKKIKLSGREIVYWKVEFIVAEANTSRLFGN